MSEHRTCPRRIRLEEEIEEKICSMDELPNSYIIKIYPEISVKKYI